MDRSISIWFFFCSCWKVADWSEVPYSRVAKMPAACPDMTKSLRTRLHGGVSRSRAKPLLLLTPQRRTTTAAWKSPRLSTSLHSRSRRDRSTPPTMWRSQTCPLQKLWLSASKMVTRSMPGLSSVSHLHPVCYQNHPVTGSGKTSPARATRAESKWLFT